jgi:hypothetical protein
MRVSNNKARDYVNGFKEFQGSNTKGIWHSWDNIWEGGPKKLYVVYSYGHHFPMYIYDKEQGKWLGNKDKYSQSTTRHQLQLRPSSVGLWLNTDEMKEVIINRGMVGYLINKAQQ